MPLLVDNKEKVVSLAMTLREKGLSVAQGLQKDTFSTALSSANQKGFTWVLLVGSDELEKGTFSLKNMDSGEQTECESLDKVVEMIQSESRI